MTNNCSCKGVRLCKLCEHSKHPRQTLNVSKITKAFVLCAKCGLSFEVDKTSGVLGNSTIRMDGVQVSYEVITEQEERFLAEKIEDTAWVESQSGRRKQDFGPKVNFKKKRVKLDAFNGFPDYMEVLQRCLSKVQDLADFRPVELCNLKYSPERGSCIDPHMDDSWLWGDRLVTLNLMGSTVLTFSRAEDFSNLTLTSAEVEPYALSTSIVNRANHVCGSVLVRDINPCSVIHVALPRRSLVIVDKEARFKWHHSILREHVDEIRLAMTCRELSGEFRNPQNVAEYDIGQQLLKLAKINPTL